MNPLNLPLNKKLKFRRKKTAIINKEFETKAFIIFAQ